jgi:recombination protein RecA
MSTKNIKEDKNNNSSSLIDEIKKELNKEFGAGAVFTKNDNNKNKNMETISTGSILLDDAIGNGGLQKGRIIEIFGPESSGKTTICLHVIREIQKKGGMGAFIDVEHALDLKYAEKIGVNTNNLLVAQPNSGEEALTILESLAKKKVDVIILDSVAALVTKAEIEGAMGDAHIGQQARLMSQALKKIVAIISDSNSLVIFTNQLRSKIGVMYGNPETTCGGNALKFYTSVRIDMRRSEMIKKNDEIVGIKVRVKIVKNKCAPPFKEAIIAINYNEGITLINEILEFAVQFNLIQKSGSWYSMNGEKISQGAEAAIEYLKKHPKLIEELKIKIYKMLEDKYNNPSEISEDEVSEPDTCELASVDEKE